jgi:nicotinamidase-related amidase
MTTNAHSDVEYRRHAMKKRSAIVALQSIAIVAIVLLSAWGCNVEKSGTRTALLVIDVQQELFEEPTPVYRADEVLRNINTLVDRAHSAAVPIFWVQHSDDKVLVEGTDGWQLHPALLPLKSDNFIRKHHGNAFQETLLKVELDALRVERVVVVGLVTDACVQATCYGAHELGYDVVLVKDAHSTNGLNGELVIDYWNTELSQGIVRLQATADVDF